MLLDNYLSYLQEQAKWKALARAGKLGTKELERLRTTGIVKPYEEYMKGVKKGTGEILKKQGATSKKGGLSRFFGPVSLPSTVPGKSKIYMPAKKFPLLLRLGMKQKYGIDITKVDFRNLYSFMERHEAYEIEESMRQLKILKSVPPTSFWSGGEKIGQHAGPRVLFKEKKDFDFIKNIYDTPAFRKWGEIRRQTKEYDYIESLGKKVSKEDRAILKQKLEQLKPVLLRERGIIVLRVHGIIDRIKKRIILKIIDFRKKFVGIAYKEIPGGNERNRIIGVEIEIEKIQIREWNSKLIELENTLINSIKAY